MRCMLCEAWSFSHICKHCQKSTLSPQLHKRKLLNSIPVYSFYPYSAIEPLLLTKHTDLGYYIYNIMAKNSFVTFAREWSYENRVASISLDDRSKNNFSHTAVLNRHLKSDNITPYFGKLRASSDFKYAGKSIQERLLHPREFVYKEFKEDEVILVDDIVTTGTTFIEAIETLESHGKKVIMCLSLSDAENR